AERSSPEAAAAPSHSRRPSRGSVMSSPSTAVSSQDPWSYPRRMLHVRAYTGDTNDYRKGGPELTFERGKYSGSRRSALGGCGRGEADGFPDRFGVDLALGRLGIEEQSRAGLLGPGAQKLLHHW